MQDKATNADEAYVVCNPDVPLQSDDPRYVDFTLVRGGTNLAETVVRRIQRIDLSAQRSLSQPRFLKPLITGHRGCGKSTELLRVKLALEQAGYFVVYFDSIKEIDINDVDCVDILLSITRQLEEQLRESPLKIQLPQKQLETIGLWLAKTVYQTDDIDTIENRFEAELGLGAEIPLFVKALLKVKSIITGASTQRKTVRLEVTNRISQLLTDLNDLIDYAQIKLRDNGKKGLVIIVDSLEKILLKPLNELGHITTHSAIYIEHGEHLKTPNCHILYTVPISLLRNENVGQIFTDETLIVPMVKVKDDKGNDMQDGLDAMRKMLACRLEIDKVFENPKSVDDLARTSGGHVRDFLRLVRFACDHSRTQITEDAVNKGIKELVRTYDYLVQDKDLQKLAEVYREKHLPSDAEYAHLPYHLLVLEYQNDEVWADVHPAVQKTRKFREAVTKLG
jgi:dsDNA-binding SOS-regulon protein